MEIQTGNREIQNGAGEKLGLPPLPFPEPGGSQQSGREGEQSLAKQSGRGPCPRRLMTLLPPWQETSN